MERSALRGSWDTAWHGRLLSDLVATSLCQSDGRIAVEPVDVFSLDAEAADLVEPTLCGALDQFVNFALKIVVVHRQ